MGVGGWLGGGGNNEGHRRPTDEHRVAALIPIDLSTSKTPRDKLQGSPNKLGGVERVGAELGEVETTKATKGQRMSAELRR